MATVSLGVLGAMGAVLSITGIFGMAAYSISKRLKELGIRMALGAQRKEVLQAAQGEQARLKQLTGAGGTTPSASAPAPKPAGSNPMPASNDPNAQNKPQTPPNNK